MSFFCPNGTVTEFVRGVQKSTRPFLQGSGKNFLKMPVTAILVRIFNKLLLGFLFVFLEKVLDGFFN